MADAEGQGPPFALKGLDHVVLRVADMTKSVQFYCEALGCREERRIASLGLVQLRAGAALIDLLASERPSGADPRNMDHLCLSIDPFDDAALRAHLKAQGVEIGEVAERYGAQGNGPSMYITDPDGNTVELKGPPKAGSSQA